MFDRQETFVLNIANLFLRFSSVSENIGFDIDASVMYYIEKDVFTNEVIDISFYTSNSSSNFNFINSSFQANPVRNEFINYSWFVYKGDEVIEVRVEYDDHRFVKDITARIDFIGNKVDVFVTPVAPKVHINIDPLLHPFGSLLLLYLVHIKGGLLMHASAVIDNKKAYLFTGVSGIGKSTMARLWNKCGAKVINDDRVVLRLQDDEVMIYNNPMPYYKQYPVSSSLKKIFLLKQSPKNYLKPLKGVKAYSRVMGNFIQQFYDKAMVTQHLEYIEKVLSKVEVYELGFKPDHDVVKMIREME